MEDILEGIHSLFDDDYNTRLSPPALEQNSWVALANSRLRMLSKSSQFDSDHGVKQYSAVLDQEIMAIHHALSTFRRELNSLVPISRLPIELLATIFYFLSISEPPTLLRGGGQPGWIKVTEVCHRWRCAALETPSLWAHIPTKPLNHQWTYEMASRAKAVPLSLHHEVDLFQPEHKIVAVLPLISRARDLSISSPHSAPTHVGRILLNQAPMLESLEVSLKKPNNVTNAMLNTAAAFHDDGLFALHIPTDLFSNRAPKLRRVHINDCPMSWMPSVFKGLTHFEVTRPHAKRHDPVDYDAFQMLRGLAQMHFLEVLEISYAFPREIDEASMPPEICVDLPQMGELTLRGEIYTCLVFKSRFNLPEAVHVRLQLEDELTSSRDIPAFQMGSTLPITRISLQALDHCTLQFTGWTSHRRRWIKVFQVVLRSQYAIKTVDQFANVLENLSPLSSVQKLSVDGVNIFHLPPQWDRLLSSAPSVSSVSLEGLNAASFIAALLPNSLPYKGTTSDCMLPALKSLRIRGILFNETVYHWQNWLRGEPLYTFLPRCLEQRAVAGCGLQTLNTKVRIFEDYSSITTSEVVDALRGVVDDRQR